MTDVNNVIKWIKQGHTQSLRNQNLLVDEINKLRSQAAYLAAQEKPPEGYMIQKTLIKLP